jgi:hypothetical protein
VYDKRIPPHWAFEKGVYLEKYDRDANIEAVIKCDTAYFYTDEKLWKLMGNIDIRNIKNEKFFTQLLRKIKFFSHRKLLLFTNFDNRLECLL